MDKKVRHLRQFKTKESFKKCLNNRYAKQFAKEQQSFQHCKKVPEKTKKLPKIAKQQNSFQKY